MDKECIKNKSLKDKKQALFYNLLFGALGLHRIYVGRYFTGLLYPCYVVFACILLNFLKKYENEELLIFVLFLLLVIYYIFQIRDTILIKTGKFKDNKDCYLL